MAGRRDVVEVLGDRIWSTPASLNNVLAPECERCESHSWEWHVDRYFHNFSIKYWNQTEPATSHISVHRSINTRREIHNQQWNNWKLWRHWATILDHWCSFQLCFQLLVVVVVSNLWSITIMCPWVALDTKQHNILQSFFTQYSGTSFHYFQPHLQQHREQRKRGTDWVRQTEQFSPLWRQAQDCGVYSITTGILLVVL